MTGPPAPRPFPTDPGGFRARTNGPRCEVRTYEGELIGMISPAAAGDMGGPLGEEFSVLTPRIGEEPFNLSEAELTEEWARGEDQKALEPHLPGRHLANHARFHAIHLIREHHRSEGRGATEGTQ